MQLRGQGADHHRLQGAVGRQDQAVCLQNLGVASGKLGQAQQKLDYTRQALALYSRLPGTGRDQAVCWQNLTSANIQLQDYPAAVGAADQALALLQKLPGTEREQARCLANLGVACGAQGQGERELDCYRRAVALHRTALRQHPGQEQEEELAGALVDLGIALLVSHELDPAQEALAEAEVTLRGVARSGAVAGETRIPEGLFKVQMGLGKVWRMRAACLTQPLVIMAQG